MLSLNVDTSSQACKAEAMIEANSECTCNFTRGQRYVLLPRHYHQTLLALWQRSRYPV